MGSSPVVEMPRNEAKGVAKEPVAATVSRCGAKRGSGCMGVCNDDV